MLPHISKNILLCPISQRINHTVILVTVYLIPFQHKPTIHTISLLYVRPFGDKRKPGTVIRGMSAPVDVPILILKKDQVLLTIRSRDFSFVLEEKFATIFSLLERFRIKANLIHNSAVNLSLCVDNSWHIDEAIEALREAGFDVMKAENMELLTVRGYTDELWRRYARGPQVFVRQATQSTVRVVRKRE